MKDAIEVYLDNQIGIIEVETQAPEPQKKRETKVAESGGEYQVHQFDVLAILVACNEQEDLKGEQIRDFSAYIEGLMMAKD